MPLNGAVILQRQGWEGTGSALRPGAIVKPLAIPQKRTLSGIGKDRDEAFPFWDHVFAVASKSIAIKIGSDSGDEEPGCIPSTSELPRTKTGLLSSLRPSESVTPQENLEPRLSQPSLLMAAKRVAAQRRLYAQFRRGPDLLPEEPTPAIIDDPPVESRKRKKHREPSSTKEKKKKKKYD